MVALSLLYVYYDPNQEEREREREREPEETRDISRGRLKEDD